MGHRQPLAQGPGLGRVQVPANWELARERMDHLMVPALRDELAEMGRARLVQREPELVQPALLARAAPVPAALERQAAEPLARAARAKEARVQPAGQEQARLARRPAAPAAEALELASQAAAAAPRALQEQQPESRQEASRCCTAPVGSSSSAFAAAGKPTPYRASTFPRQPKPARNGKRGGSSSTWRIHLLKGATGS